MSSLNSKREGGFSRFKGHNNVVNSRARTNFGGKKKLGSGASMVILPVNEYAATCSLCQKECEALFKPAPEKLITCSRCFTELNKPVNISLRDAFIIDSGIASDVTKILS